MIQISRRGWNNVIVFGVLALFFLFYIAPQHLAKMREHARSSVIPPTQQLLQLQFANTTAQQAGVDWRFQPQLAAAESTSTVLAATVVQAWQQQVLQVVLPAPDAIQAQVCMVGLLLSGEPEVQQWQILTDQQQSYLKLKPEPTLYGLSDMEVQALCPAVLRH